MSSSSRKAEHFGVKWEMKRSIRSIYGDLLISKRQGRALDALDCDLLAILDIIGMKTVSDHNCPLKTCLVTTSKVDGFFILLSDGSMGQHLREQLLGYSSRSNAK